MRIKKHKLLPDEVIEKAAAGEPEAVNRILQHYTGLLQVSVLFSWVHKRRYSRSLESAVNGSPV